MRKIIFLDIDGVLNNHETLAKKYRGSGIMGVDPYRVLLLNRIVEATGAEIVLSSSWRHGTEESLKTLKTTIGFIDITGTCCSGIRGVEIHNWLTKNVKGFSSDGYKKGEHKVAILDDDSDMLLWQKDHFFQTSFMGEGLTEEICTKVIEHLNR